MRVVDAFCDLVGHELAAVCFVRDYLELGFDGPVLTYDSWPVIDAMGEVHPGDGGYRDGLCSFIGQTVSAVIDDGSELGVAFAGGRLVAARHGREEDGPVVASLYGRDGLPPLTYTEWERLP